MDSNERNNNAPAPELVNIRTHRLEDLMRIPLADPLEQLAPEMGRMLEPGERLVFEPPVWTPTAQNEEERLDYQWRRDQGNPSRTSNPERRARPIHCPTCNGTSWSRLTSGTWTGVDILHSSASQWIERSEPNDSDEVEREPWVCSGCDVTPDQETQDLINHIAMDTYA